MNTECSNCLTAVDDSQLCWACAKLLRRLLRNVPWLTDRLHETAYGQGKTARAKLRVSGEGEKPGLPLNMRAAEVRRDMLRRVVLAAGEASVPVDFVGPLREWQWRWSARVGAVPAMGENLALLMRWDGVAALLADVRELSQEAERLIDLPPESQYFGPCPQCATGLYADADAQVSQVDCMRCDWSWPIEWVRDSALQAANRQQHSAADCLRLVRVLGRDVARSSFYALLTQVEPCEVEGDRIWYRLGDVVEALDERERAEAERREQGRRKRGRPRKANRQSVDKSTAECVMVDASTASR